MKLFIGLPLGTNSKEERSLIFEIISWGWVDGCGGCSSGTSRSDFVDWGFEGTWTLPLNSSQSSFFKLAICSAFFFARFAEAISLPFLRTSKRFSEMAFFEVILVLFLRVGVSSSSCFSSSSSSSSSSSLSGGACYFWLLILAFLLVFCFLTDFSGFGSVNSSISIMSSSSSICFLGIYLSPTRFLKIACNK